MDTSKEYIKMCEKAVEIQDKTEIIFAEKVSDVVIVDGDWWFYAGADSNQYKKIWLPRQDQLQGMIQGSVWEKILRFKDFHHVKEDGSPIQRISCGLENITTFEQLWLAFVMKEKFNKTWNGEDWICQ